MTDATMNIPDNDELRVQIGERLIWLREAFGHTQAQWSRQIGVSSSTLNRWELGSRLPPIDILIAIVSATEASLDYVLRGHLTAEMNPKLARALWRAHGGQLVWPPMRRAVRHETRPAGPAQMPHRARPEMDGAAVLSLAVA